MLASDTAFWLDVEHPTEEFIDSLASSLSLHPLAVEDSKQWDQRGKLVRYGDVAMFIGFGLEAGVPVEVHGYIGEHFLVTFRRADLSSMDELHRSGSVRALLGQPPIVLLHHVATAIHEPFPLYVDSLEERLQVVEEAMISEPFGDYLVEIRDIRQQASELRRILTPGRDLAERSAVTPALPGAGDDALLYIRDIADELHQLVGDLAAVGERCIAAVSLQASLTSSRQADASSRLAAVATIFLPITFVVGFFGMNFDVLINDFEQGWVAFLVWGVALNVACTAAIVVWLRRRRLL
jgi:magnesium transporter